MLRTPRTWALWLAAFVVTVTPAVGDATFTQIGQAGFFTNVAGMSADGVWVVGNGADAFRWSEATGVELLPGTSGGLDGISDDGSTIIGDVPDAKGITTAGLWTETTGWVSLGSFPDADPGDNTLSNGWDVSADGSVACGLGWDFDPFLAHGFRWTEETGMVDTGSSGNASRCTAISADGNILVGFDENPDFGNRRTGVWTEATGWFTLGSLDPFDPVDGPGECLGISADGSIIVGTSAGNAFLYTIQRGLVNIGTTASAAKVSDNGDVIVGSTGDFFSGFEAAIRTQTSRTMQNLQDWLVSLGATGLDGWTLTNANGVSADGNVIAGTGINPGGLVDAFVAKLNDNKHELTLTVDPLVAGTTVMAQVSGAEPNAEVALAFSPNGRGITPLPALGIALNLTNPRLGDMTTADANGDAVLLLEIPAGAAGEATLQAGQPGNPGRTSNVVVDTVQ